MELTAMDRRMIPIYAALVKAGTRTIDSVPERVRAAVEEALDDTNNA